MNNLICIIPARGGSKGIVNKNMQMLGVSSLVGHSIIHAKNADIPWDKIIVSSDNDNILAEATEYGVIAHRRPAELSGDEATTESAMVDVIEHFDSDSILLLQPTSPIRLSGRVEHCIMTYEENDCDSLIATTKFYNLFWSEHDNPPVGYSWACTTEEMNRPRRQELSRENYRYFDNGNLYISDTRMFKKRNNRIGYKPYIYTITELEAMQIDTVEDLKIMRCLFNKITGSIGRLPHVGNC